MPEIPGPGSPHRVESSFTSKRRVLQWAGTLIAVLLLVYLLAQQGWEEFFQAFQRIRLQDFLAAAGIMLLSRVAVCGRWYVLLRSAGVKIPLTQTARLVFAGLFASNFLPTTVGGDVVRLVGTVQLGLDGSICAASLVVDRIVGLVGMACMLPFGLPRMAAGVVLGGPGAMLSSTPIALRLKPFAEKGRQLAGKFIRAFSLWAHQPFALGQALVWSFGHMLCVFLGSWVLLQGMHEPVSLLVIGGLWSLSYFITLLPVSVNGLGVQEVAITYLFSTFGGVSLPAGLALAILMRMLYLLASLPGAIFLPGLLAARRENR